MTDYYANCSEKGRLVLACFQLPSSYFDIECNQAMLKLGWHNDAYLYNAAKYCWRMGKKGGDEQGDIAKAITYLEWWQKCNNSFAALLDLKTLKPQVAAALAVLELLRDPTHDTNP